MNTSRALNSLNAALWLTNAGVWSWYSHSLGMTFLALCGTLVSAYLAWSEPR